MTPPRSRQPGELERSVMRVLWERGASSAAEVRAALPTPTPAMTTVLTVLDRLRVKGRVSRVEARDALRFAPLVGETESAAAAMLAALESSADRGAALVRFAGDLSAAEIVVLRDALARDGD